MVNCIQELNIRKYADEWLAESYLCLSGTAILNEEWTENGVQHLLIDNQYEIKRCVI